MNRFGHGRTLDRESFWMFTFRLKRRELVTCLFSLQFGLIL